jgi:hypothetical protein
MFFFDGLWLIISFQEKTNYPEKNPCETEQRDSVLVMDNRFGWKM